MTLVAEDSRRCPRCDGEDSSIEFHGVVGYAHCRDCGCEWNEVAAELVLKSRAMTEAEIMQDLSSCVRETVEAITQLANVCDYASEAVTSEDSASISFTYVELPLGIGK